MKLALVSHVLPPSDSGQATVLYRLFKTLDPASYCLMSARRYENYCSAQDDTSRLSGKYYPLPGWQLTRGSRYGLAVIRSILNLILMPFAIILRAWSIARVVRRDQCDALVSCSGDLIDLPAAYLASRWTSIPLAAYFFDDYTFQWLTPWTRFIAGKLERLIVQGALSVIVPNEFLSEEIFRRHGVRATIIRNPVETIAGDSLFPPRLRHDDEIRIVYTGSVYEAHYDAFRNLLKAIERSGQTNLQLHVHTAQPAERLRRVLDSDRVVFHEHLPLSAMPALQQSADILFLPLSFGAGYPSMLIRTSAPGKMGEYLASGKPVLAHAPSDSFVSWYLKIHDAAYVVDQAEPACLMQAIDEILNRPELCARRRINALGLARSDFSITRARAVFLGLFEHAHS